MIGPDDFRSPIDGARTPFRLWVTRRALIDNVLADLRTMTISRGSGQPAFADLDARLMSMQQPTSGTDVRPWPENRPQPRADLLQLHQQVRAAGLSRERAETLRVEIESTYHLSLDALARLVALGNKYERWLVDPAQNPALSREDTEDLDNILVQARKLSLFPRWVEEEQQTPIVLGAETFWPSLFEPVEGAWPPTEPKPYVDPEQITLADLPAGIVGDAARRLYRERVDEIAQTRNRLRQALQGSADPEDALVIVYNPPSGQTWRARFVELHATLRSSTDEARIRAARDAITNTLYLTIDEFLRLSSLIELYGRAEVGDADVADAADILTSAYTRRQRTDWLLGERDLRDWQLLRMRRPPWRASAEARAGWTRALRTRSQPPIIDPDLLDFAMLADWQGGDARQAWRVRSRIISDILSDLDRRRRSQPTALEGFATIAVGAIFPPQVIADRGQASLMAFLSELYQTMDRERDATRRIEQLGLSRGAFIALMRSYNRVHPDYFTFLLGLRQATQIPMRKDLSI